MPRRYDAQKFTLAHLRATAEKCKNWGKWGPDDQVGTLNYVTPQNVIDASRLVRKGKVFSLGLNFDRTGPQRGLWGNRFNPDRKSTRLNFSHVSESRMPSSA